MRANDYDEGAHGELVKLFWPTALRQLASGSASQPDRTMALAHMEACAALVEALLAGEGGKALGARLAADGDGLAALAQALAATPTVPSFCAQLHLSLALFRSRRALKRVGAPGGGPAAVQRLCAGVMVRARRAAAGGARLQAGRLGADAGGAPALPSRPRLLTASTHGSLSPLVHPTPLPCSPSWWPWRTSTAPPRRAACAPLRSGCCWARCDAVGG